MVYVFIKQTSVSFYNFHLFDFTDSFMHLPCSASDFNDEEQFSEFWNREDEASASEEDISDSDGISQSLTEY